MLGLVTRMVNRKPHDVVRVHEGHREMPGFVVVGMRAQPVDRIRGNDRIEEATAPSRPCVMHVITPKILVAVGGHFRDVLVRKMPFAQVSTVISVVYQKAPDCRNCRIQSCVSRKRDVVDHPMLGEITTGVETCPRRRAGRRVCVVAVERQPVGSQPIVRRKVSFAGQPIVASLLIGNDQQNVGLFVHNRSVERSTQPGYMGGHN